jgi:hypothetical protein
MTKSFYHGSRFPGRDVNPSTPGYETVSAAVSLWLEFCHVCGFVNCETHGRLVCFKCRAMKVYL